MNMKEKVSLENWYKNLPWIAKAALYIFIFGILFSLLVYFGLESKNISQITKDNINDENRRAFIYSIKFLILNEKHQINWVAIGAVGVLISYWITVKENAKKIDADLKAKARIDWIQKVKERTSELIASVTIYNFSSNSNEETWSKVNKHISLLILQFGPEASSKASKRKCQNWIYYDNSSNQIKIKKNTNRKLLSKRTNENKNEMIVQYLISLRKFCKANQYSKNQNDIEELINERNKIIDKEHLTEVKYTPKIDKFYKFSELLRSDKDGNLLYDEETELYSSKRSVNYLNPRYKDLENDYLPDDAVVVFPSKYIGKNFNDMVDKEFILYFFHYDEDLIFKIEEYNQAIINLQIALIKTDEYLDFLSEIMRIYLKIEWNIAKEGK